MYFRCIYIYKFRCILSSCFSLRNRNTWSRSCMAVHLLQNLKTKYFFLKKSLLFAKYTWFAEKNCFYMEKKFYIEKFFYWKKIFLEKKYMWTCKKYISHLRNIYTENVCVTNKIWIFLKYIFILQKKFFLILKNSFGSTQSVVFLKLALPKT